MSFDGASMPMQGACVNPDGTVSFRVWAPRCRQVAVAGENQKLTVPMQPAESGWWEVTTGLFRSSDAYCFLLDNQRRRPDPAGRAFVDTVHGLCRIVDPSVWDWHDRDWRGIPLHRTVFYELHPAAFTPEGTLDAAVARLDYLVELGITCVELMPVAQFPGARNWGYDGVGLYAVQNSYGGPEALQRFVDACHSRGLAVCLDVVYNHLGPEGNYLHEYGPYFTDRYHTPWGMALNYDGPDSDPVRRFVIDNALWWIQTFHIDMLRLDAVHEIYDFSGWHILDELQYEVQAFAAANGRIVNVIAESDLNDARLLQDRQRGGFSLDGQWSDDFHHALHALLTGEQAGYYADFGRVEDLAQAMDRGFVYNGIYSAYRRRRHGNNTGGTRPEQFVVCIQNHDQVGNRAAGDRLAVHLTAAQQRAAAFALLLTPCTPLLFMGQEYGETAPFEYFVDHTDPELLEAVRNGRRQEFSGFDWHQVPDPAQPEALERSRINPALAGKPGHCGLLALYRELLRMRAEDPLFGVQRLLDWASLRAAADAAQRTVSLCMSQDNAAEALLLLSFNAATVRMAAGPAGADGWRALCSEERRFGGTLDRAPVPDSNGTVELPPYSALFFRRI